MREWGLSELVPPKGPPKGPSKGGGWRAAGGFTLIEVVLALAIATGLLIAALLFYRQATELRGQILRESDRCTAVRLVLDRITADLRETVPDGAQEGFLGGADALSFLRHAAFETGMTNTGLVRISFFTRKAVEGTNTLVVGFDRREEKLFARAPRAVDLAFGSATSTNRMSEPLTEDVRYIRFRYWDGAAWLEAWTNAMPPPGVEIVLGPDPVTEDANANPNPTAAIPGLVRRVVAVPTGIALRRSAADAFTDPSTP